MSEHKVELEVRLNTDKVGKDFESLEKQAKEGAGSVGDAMDDMQKSVDDMAAKTKSSTKETETAYGRLVKKIQEQQEEVRQLKQQYQNAALEFGETSDEAKTLAAKIEEASSELGKNQAAFRDSAEAANRFDKSLEDVTDSLEEGAGKASLFGDVLKGSLASAAIEKGIGLLASGIQAAVSGAIEMDGASKKLQASIGATAEEMEGYNAAMNGMYKAGYGDSITEVADAMALVKQYTGEVDPSKIQQLAENAMALDDTFSGMDMEETLRGVDSLMVNMGLDAEEAFDYIVVGAQNGLDKSGELADNIAEYGPLWSQAGFSAEEMFTILQNGLENGAYSLDKVNDFVKEFGISLSDGRIEENLGSFSTGTQNLFAAWQNGEATTKEVFYSVINDLSQMANQQEALTVASNTWSSMGEDNAMAMITSLTNLNGTYSDVRGSMESLKEVRYDSLENQYKQLGRTVQTDLVQPLAQKLLPVAQKGLKFIADNLDVIVPVAGAAGAAMATIWVTKKAQSLIDRLKDTGKLIAGLVTGTTKQAAATAADTVATTANTAAKGAQAAATGAATVAQNGLNAAMKANPVGLVVTAVSGLVAGLAALGALVGKSDAAKLADEMEEAREQAEQARDEYQELSSEYHNQSDEIMGLWRKVQDLSEVENKSAQQKRELRSLVDELNKKVPDLGLSYDELSDSLNKTSAAIDEVVRASAAQEAYDSAVEARTQAAKDYNQAAADQKNAVEKLDEAEKRLQEDIALNPQYYEEYGETVHGAQADVDTLKHAVEEADGALEAASETLEQAALDEQYYGLMVADVDANTRSLINTTLEQIDEVVRASAAQEAYDSAVEARTQAAKDYNQAAADQKNAVEKLDEAEKRLQEDIALNPQYYEEYGETVHGAQADVDTLKHAVEEADGALEAASETLEQAALDEQYYGLMVADVDANTRSLINTTLEQIDSLGRQDEAYGESVGALSMLTDAHISAKETIQAEIDQINTKISELQQQYDEAYNSAYTSITGQLGLFNTMTTNSTMSVDQMVGALDSQIAYLDTFSQNMQTAISWGVDEGLLSQLSDGSEESAAILQSIVEAGQDKIMGPGGLNEKFGKVEEGKKKFSTTIADMETDFSESMDALQTDLDTAMSKMDKADEMYQSGINSIQGYINGTEELRDDLIAQFQSLANSAEGAFNVELEEHSPSRVFRRSGRYSVQGAVLGAEDEKPNLIETYTDLGKSVISAYTGALDDSMASRRMADVYDVVNAHSAGIGQAYHGGGMEILSGKNNSRSFSDEDIRKLAKEYGKITAGYWGDMKYVFDGREMGRMVRKVS